MILASMAKLFLIDMIFSTPHYYYIWSLFTKYVWFKWKNDTGLMEIIDNDNEHGNDADIGNYWLLIK